MRQLLECGVHFGHQTKRWNPKMKKYIFTSRNGIHVIDLQQSIQLINVAYEFVKEVSKNDGTVLFVGTKKQAQDAVKEESERSEMPFVNFRWLGGTLTNISTIRQSINKLKDFEKMKESNEFELLSKKEQSKKTKLYNKLNNMFVGIKSMIKLPSALFIIDTQKEQLAIQEAKKLNIPIIGVVDTNANPNEIDYPIPANDDAIRAVKLICSIIADAVVAGQVEKLAQNIAPSAEDSAGDNITVDNNNAQPELTDEANDTSKNPPVSNEQDIKKPTKKHAVASDKESNAKAKSAISQKEVTLESDKPVSKAKKESAKSVATAKSSTSKTAATKAAASKPSASKTATTKSAASKPSASKTKATKSAKTTTAAKSSTSKTTATKSTTSSTSSASKTEAKAKSASMSDSKAKAASKKNKGE
ncbi:30S ribosomal protein S2 [Candidatus Marinamargulisbacteria bacterium SCGC AG-333-B06]|nr:30S ribosomal protein S2 [Candidatus Marinamargulisbacteria bacterium SCGC AG-333-B06]